MQGTGFSAFLFASSKNLEADIFVPEFWVLMGERTQQFDALGIFEDGDLYAEFFKPFVAT